jgi:hypothetical protein
LVDGASCAAAGGSGEKNLSKSQLSKNRRGGRWCGAHDEAEDACHAEEGSRTVQSGSSDANSSSGGSGGSGGLIVTSSGSSCCKVDALTVAVSSR